MNIDLGVHIKNERNKRKEEEEKKIQVKHLKGAYVQMKNKWNECGNY